MIVVGLKKLVGGEREPELIEFEPQVPNGVVLFVHGIFLSCNHIVEIFGYIGKPDHEVIQRDFSPIFHNVDIKNHRSIIMDPYTDVNEKMWISCCLQMYCE